jgi:prepilin-type processing-associated H-X9-DG protein
MPALNDGANKNTISVFYCPTNASSCWQREPSSVIDTTIQLDVWYNINGQTQNGGSYINASYSSFGSTTYTGGMTPAYLIPYPQSGSTYAISPYAPKLSGIRHSATTVLFFEGTATPAAGKLPQMALNVWWSTSTGNPSRWLAPHNRGRATNLAFCDGHAVTIPYEIDPATGWPRHGPKEPDTGDAYGVDWFADR